MICELFTKMQLLQLIVKQNLFCKAAFDYHTICKAFEGINHLPLLISVSIVSQCALNPNGDFIYEENISTLHYLDYLFLR